MAENEGIYIGGLACRMPKSRNAQEFWENLSSGKDMVGPTTRWPSKLYGLPSRVGSVPDINMFDNIYFNIPDEQVNGMNPMLRHLLEVTYECCVDSCLSMTTLRMCKTGLYVACCGSDTDCFETISCHHGTSSSLASELVRHMGITGPCITVDTGASSSLAALKMASTDLQEEKCDFAIVAGCDLVLNPLIGRQMMDLNQLSPDGKSCVCDAQASGGVRAEGVAAILLAGHAYNLARVYCNVVDIGFVFDGSSHSGLGAASYPEQADMIEDLYEQNGIDLDQVQYVELHGAATQEFDKEEVESLHTVFCVDKERQTPLLIGSVSSNMGNTEATAGLASLIKCILALHYGELPSNLNMTTPNPAIQGLINGQLQIVTKNTKLTGQYIAINSMCPGGVAGHMILKQYSRKDTEEFEKIGGHMVIPLTVRNKTGVSNVVQFVGNNRYNSDILGLVSRSLLSCDHQQPIRGFIQITPQDDDVQVQCQLWDGEMPDILVCLEDFVGGKIAVTPDLLEIDCFMTALQRCAQSVQRFDPDLDLVAVFRSNEPLLSITRVGMLAAASLLICLEDCLEHAGIMMDEIMACGLSEIVGAYIDGCLSLDQCLLIYNCIGKHLEQFSKLAVDKWQIYDVRLEVEQVYQLGPWVQILNIQDADHVTISIETKFKHKILSKIHQKGGFYNLRPSNVPLYSGYMRGLAKTIKQELRDIVPCPVYRSRHLTTCRLGGQTGPQRQHYDTDYISSIICEPVHQYYALQHQPDTSLRLRIIPTSSTSMLYKLHSQGDLDFTVASDLSCISQNQSVCSDKGQRSQSGLRCISVSTQSDMDNMEDEEEEKEGEYIISKGQNTVTCLASCRSLCQTLGEIHMHGSRVNVQILQAVPCQPLGVKAPCLSPLVAWQHTTPWHIPLWTAFSNTVEEAQRSSVYMLRDEDIEETHNPLAVLLYHTWSAIANKLGHASVNEVAVRLYQLEMADDSSLTIDHVIKAMIEVFVGGGTFVVSLNDDMVLMKGRFEVKDTFPLPSITGYDLDINDNVKLDQNNSCVECDKSEISWEDSWPDFLTDFLEVASVYLNKSDLLELVLEPRYHLREAKQCPTFLAVLENTGICRSGGCVLLFNTPLIDTNPEATPTKVAVDNAGGTFVTKAMVYGIQSPKTSEDQLILYQAEKRGEVTPANVLGLVNLRGDVLTREITLPANWEADHLELLVPFILASHLLLDVAQVSLGQTILVLPPIDTVSMYVIALAVEIGCSVFASSHDPETIECLESTFPNIRVLPGATMHRDLMLLTQGHGVKLCVRVSSGDVSSALECISDNGHLIQCIPPDTGLPDLTQMASRRNGRVSIVRPLDAFSTFMKKSAEDISLLMYNIKDISKLTTEGFPEKKGVLYREENSSTFMQPINIEKMLSVVMEPNLGVTMETFMEADALCLEKIQNLVLEKPKDFSLVEPVSVRNPIQANTGEILNLGMIATPSVHMETNLSQDRTSSPEVNIISLLDSTKDLTISPLKGKKVWDETKTVPSTSTPMCISEHTSCHGNKQLEESYLDTGRRETIMVFNDSMAELVGGDHAPSGPKKDVKKEPNTEAFKEDSKTGSVDKTPKDNCDGTRISTGSPTKILAGEADGVEKAAEEDNPDRSIPHIYVNGVSNIRPPSLSTPVPLSWTTGRSKIFRSHMEQKLKPVPPKLQLLKPRLDLIRLAPPFTPMTPILKEVLTPVLVPNLVPLNHLRNDVGKPLYIVHPATGITWMLEGLGTRLRIPCYGIQRTSSTPSESVHSVASYYRNAIEMMQPSGPYRIAGYGYGTMIALEIALQLQAEGKKVDGLMMLDGSPMYVHAQITSGLKLVHVPVNATKAQIDEAVELGALLKWVSLYREVPRQHLTYDVMKKLKTQDERVNTAVDLTFGDAIVSSSPLVTRWLKAGKIVMSKRLESVTRAEDFASTAKEIIRLKRREKAMDYLTHIKIARTYVTSSPFEGDIYLHRIKSDPPFECLVLPTDYGLHNQCTGKVHVQLYDASHDSLLTKNSLSALVNNLHNNLGVKET